MRALILFLLIATISISKAQPVIGMSTVIPTNLNDTVSAGSIESYTVYVKNTGNALFNDSLTIYTAVLDSLSGLNIVNVYSSNGNTSILPGDSVSFTMTTVYNLSPTGYKTGIDVIVVWPVAQTAATLDSLTFNVFIIATSGVNEIDFNEYFKVYPNPASEQIDVIPLKQSSIKSIQLFDMQGKCIETIQNEHILNIEKLNKGMYLLSISLENGKNYQTKIIKK